MTDRRCVEFPGLTICPIKVGPRGGEYVLNELVYMITIVMS